MWCLQPPLPPPKHRPTPSPYIRPSPLPAKTINHPPSTLPLIPTVTLEPLQKLMPTNKEILSNPILFHSHIIEIDHELNYFPNSNPTPPMMQLAQYSNPEPTVPSDTLKSIVPQKESLDFEGTFQ